MFYQLEIKSNGTVRYGPNLAAEITLAKLVLALSVLNFFDELDTPFASKTYGVYSTDETVVPNSLSLACNLREARWQLDDGIVSQ